MAVCLAYITSEDIREARRIGRSLVEDRLAACVNVIENMSSMYWWDGKIEEGREVIVIAKTRVDLMDALISRVEDMHRAENPCVIRIDAAGGRAPFFDWIESETA